LTARSGVILALASDAEENQSRGTSCQSCSTYCKKRAVWALRELSKPQVLPGFVVVLLSYGPTTARARLSAAASPTKLLMRHETARRRSRQQQNSETAATHRSCVEGLVGQGGARRPQATPTGRSSKAIAHVERGARLSVQRLPAGLPCAGSSRTRRDDGTGRRQAGEATEGGARAASKLRSRQHFCAGSRGLLFCQWWHAVAVILSVICSGHPNWAGVHWLPQPCARGCTDARQAQQRSAT